MHSWLTSSPQWQTYNAYEPITPTLEEAFRQASLAAFRHGPQTLRFSTTSSVTSRDGRTSCHTQLRVGKRTSWTEAEVRSLEGYLARWCGHHQLTE
ncbi:hypothetical protein IAU60_002042 [Kwoniella sp. DSM 27419]